MGNLIIGKNSAIQGFAILFFCIVSLIVGCIATDYCFKGAEPFFGVLCIFTTISWLITIIVIGKLIEAPILGGNLMLTLRYLLFETIGFAFVINKTTKEIHRLKLSRPECLLDSMIKRRYATKLYALYLIKYKGYNGCNYCWKEKNKTI